MAWNDLTYNHKLHVSLPRYCRNIANDNRLKCIKNLDIDPVDLLPAKWSELDFEQRLELRQQLFNLADKAETVRREAWRASNPDFKARPETIELIYHVAGKSS
jgi:hypothetical protein